MISSWTNKRLSMALPSIRDSKIFRCTNLSQTFASMGVCIRALKKLSQILSQNNWELFEKLRMLISPKIYIIKKLLSTARPDIKREIENIGTLIEKTVMPLPNSAIIFAKISTGRRPTESASEPNICVPKTEPTKNIDCPIVDFHAESHTQSNC